MSPQKKSCLVILVVTSEIAFGGVTRIRRVRVFGFFQDIFFYNSTFSCEQSKKGAPVFFFCFFMGEWRIFPNYVGNISYTETGNFDVCRKSDWLWWGLEHEMGHRQPRSLCYHGEDPHVHSRGPWMISRQISFDFGNKLMVTKNSQRYWCLRLIFFKTPFIFYNVLPNVKHIKTQDEVVDHMEHLYPISWVVPRFGVFFFPFVPGDFTSPPRELPVRSH